MEIKSSAYVAPVAQNTKPESTKQLAEEMTKSNSTEWQDDIVTLSSSGGGHPERPPKEGGSLTLQDDIVSLSTSGGSHPERPPEPKPEKPIKT